MQRTRHSLHKLQCARNLQLLQRRFHSLDRHSIAYTNTNECLSKGNVTGGLCPILAFFRCAFGINSILIVNIAEPLIAGPQFFGTYKYSLDCVASEVQPVEYVLDAVRWSIATRNTSPTTFQNLKTTLLRQ